MDCIHIKGAREHNLKNLDLVLPRNRLVVITGLSGSGKSSLAFDTLYAEGQRRYVESLSAYARQFLDQMEKPDVDSIEGLSPAISIEQKTTSRNPRSTVATVTEIYDYLRLLFARVGRPVCMACGQPIASQTIQEMADQILAQPEGTRIQLLAPVVRARKGEYRKLLADLMKRGYIRARVNGEMLDLTDGLPDLDKQKKHTIEVVIDRLKVAPAISSRLADSLEIACNLAEGTALVDLDGTERLFSSKLACNNAECQRFGLGLPDLEPRSFSFNSPFGACTACDGLGFKRQFAEELIVPNPDLSISQGCIQASGWKSAGEDGWRGQFLEQLGRALSFRLDTPWKKLSADVRQVLLHGLDRKMKFIYQNKGNRYEFMHNFEGVVGNLERRYRETSSEEIRAEMEESMRITPCEACAGMRLRPEVLSVFVGGLHIAAVAALSVREARAWFEELAPGGQGGRHRREGPEGDQGAPGLPGRRRAGLPDPGPLRRHPQRRRGPAHPPGHPDRLQAAGRHVRAGRAQHRPAPARQPEAAAHPQGDARPGQHRAGGGARPGDHPGARTTWWTWAPGPASTAATWWPRAPPRRSAAAKPPSPARSCAAAERIPVPAPAARPPGASLQVLRGPGEQPAQGGRGLPHRPVHLRHRRLGLGQEHPGERDPLQGPGQPAAPGRPRGGQAPGDQGPGRTWTRSSTSTRPPSAAPRGATPPPTPACSPPCASCSPSCRRARPGATRRGAFSFNVKGGRCEKCEGDGVLKIEMHFLPDIYVTCEQCKGKRYNRETLEVHYKGKSISDVLAMTVEEALDLFGPIPALANKLQTLHGRGPGLHPAGPERHHPVRRRGPAGEAGARSCPSAPPGAPSTSWTSPPPGCTSRTSRSCWRSSTG